MELAAGGKWGCISPAGDGELRIEPKHPLRLFLLLDFLFFVCRRGGSGLPRGCRGRRALRGVRLGCADLGLHRRRLVRAGTLLGASVSAAERNGQPEANYSQTKKPQIHSPKMPGQEFLSLRLGRQSLGCGVRALRFAPGQSPRFARSRRVGTGHGILRPRRIALAAEPRSRRPTIRRSGTSTVHAMG